MTGWRRFGSHARTGRKGEKCVRLEPMFGCFLVLSAPGFKTVLCNGEAGFYCFLPCFVLTRA